MPPKTFMPCAEAESDQEPACAPHLIIDVMPFAYRQALLPPALNAHTHYRRGLEFRADNKIPEALDSFRQAAHLQPQMVEAHIALGETHVAVGDHANAIVNLRRALVLAPNVWQLHADIGTNLRALERWGEAALSYRRALALQPENLHLYVSLVQVLGEQGRVNEARQCLECANARVPITTTALQTLNTAWQALMFIEEEARQKIQEGRFPV